MLSTIIKLIKKITSYKTTKNVTLSLDEINKRIYVRNIDYWKKYLQRNYYNDKALKVIEIDDGIILPTIPKKDGFENEFMGGVCDKKLNFISGLRRTPEGKRNPGFFGSITGYNISNNDIKYIPETVIFGGIANGLFGHFLIDTLPNRLWYVIKNKTQNFKIVFVIIQKEKSFFNSFFELLGISDRILIIKEPTQFKKIIVPEESVHTWDCYTSEFMTVYKYICKNIKKQSPFGRKIYLTHTQCNTGPECINEEYFESFFKKQKFEIVALEKYPINIQISILLNADEVATTLGTISHMAIFCKPKTTLIILTRVSDSVLVAQNIINCANKLNYYIVDVSLNFLPVDRTLTNGPILLGCTSQWKNFVKYYFNSEYQKKNLTQNSNELLDNSENSVEKFCYKFLTSWAKFYKSYYAFNRIKNIDVSSIVNNLNAVLFNSNNTIMKGNRSKNIWNFRTLNDIKNLMRNNLQRDFLLYETHFAYFGWMPPFFEGQDVFEDHKLQLEAIKIYFCDSSESIYYSVYSTENNWSEYAKNGEVAGTVGKKIPITAIKIHLLPSSIFSVIYRIFNKDKGWTNWVSNNSICSQSGSKIHGIQIRLLKKPILSS